MEHQSRVRYIPDGPSAPQGKPSRSSSESPPSSKSHRRFSFGIPPFRRRPESPPLPTTASETSATRPAASRTGGKGWSFPLRLKSAKVREEQQQRESSMEVVDGGKEGDEPAEEARRGMSSEDIAVAQQERYPSPRRYHHQVGVIGSRRNAPLLTSPHTPVLRPPAEQQHLGRAPPSPRDEFPFPIVPPTTTHGPRQPAHLSPTSSTATTPRLVPRTRPPPLQAISSPLPPAAPPLHPFPPPQHLPTSNSPSAPHQAFALHPQQHLQSRFAESLPRPSPLSLPAPTHPRRPPSPLQLERQRTPSTSSSISPSIQLPAYYAFPFRTPNQPPRMPYEQPVSRFSDWTSTNDSIDSPWDEPFPRTDDSGGGRASRRASLATEGSSLRDRWRYSAPEVVGESDGDADGEENGEETDEQENSREMRGRLKQRKSHSDDGSSRPPSRHRRAEHKPRMVSTSTQTTEDLLLFYNSHISPSINLESAPSTSSSQQPHRRAPPPPPSPSSQLLHNAASSSSLRRPPAHSESSSSAATFCTSTADTSVQGLDAFPATAAAFAEGLRPPPLSPVEESRSRRSSSAGLETGDHSFRKRMSALAEWMGATKAQKEARRRTA